MKANSVCHFYLFADGCPTDWLQAGHDEDWHTIAYFAFQSDPSLDSKRVSGLDHTAILPLDSLFNEILQAFFVQSTGQYCLKKWKSGSGGSSYRLNFIKSLSEIDSEKYPQLNAISFQEKELRSYEQQLLEEFNTLFGGQPIGFEFVTDSRSRPAWRHSYMHWQTGFHVIERPVEQLLVLLLMARIIGDQFSFYRNKILGNKALGFEAFQMTVVSDRLSGDNDLRSYCEYTLRFLLSTDQEQISLTRSNVSDTFIGDLLVDNVAGLLNECMANPKGELAKQLKKISHLKCLEGWQVLRSEDKKHVLKPYWTAFLTEKTG